MFLVFILILLCAFPSFVEANWDQDNRYCKVDTRADEIFDGLAFKMRDIGFPVEVHAVDGEIQTHVFNKARVLKEIKSETYTLSYWTIESNQGINGLTSDGYTSLLNLVNKLEQCQFEILSELEKLLLTSYFPSYGKEITSIYVAENKQFIIASSNISKSFNIVYATPNNDIVVKGDLGKK